MITYWFKTLSKFVTIQIFVQLLSLASGILLVRTLNRNEYAYFTIANTMQGTMSVLADSGVGCALSAIGGKVWQDRQRFGQLINTAIHIRRYLSIISITAVTPILIWMLVSNGASIIYTIAIVLAVIIGFNFQLNTGVLIVVPKLHSQINRIQNLDLISAISRLTLLVFAYLTFMNTAVALVTASITFGLKNLLLNRWIADSINTKAPFNKQDQTDILKSIKYQAPNAIFYCFQGQITVWLISIFGNVQSIAEIGALSRLGVIFYIITSILNSIVLPKFARCQSVELLSKRYWQILGVYCLISTGLLGVALLFPRQLLWILGNQYTNLEKEVFLMVISTVVQSFGGILWSINASKAWIRYSWLFIPIIIATQVFLLMFLNISTVTGVILFNLFSILPALFLNFYMTYEGIRSYESC
jgi:O-antigen/teichoic acid export membrane protein